MKMKQAFKKSFLSLLVILVLFAATALAFTACDKGGDATETMASEVAFTVEVTKLDGTTSTYSLRSNKSNLGEALIEEGMISGEDGAYGWFITTVDGEYHKWEDDGKYWAFYINGEYATSGVSSTQIAAGAVYSFKVE